jgi:hypothetical protein
MNTLLLIEMRWDYRPLKSFKRSMSGTHANHASGNHKANRTDIFIDIPIYQFINIQNTVIDFTAINKFATPPTPRPWGLTSPP